MNTSSGVDTTAIWDVSAKQSQDSAWEDMQKKTFAGWANMHLAQRDMQVQNLESDLCDGVKLITLLEILNGKPIEGRYYKSPKSKPYYIANVNFAINYITENLGIKLISCSAEDVVDGNIKIILGILWRLIHRFQLKNDQNSRNLLLHWCSENVKDYPGVSVQNFHASFQDGLAFCALMHKFNPDSIDFLSLSKRAVEENLATAFSIAERDLKVPQLLPVSDLAKGISDERSVMTYLALIKAAFESSGSNRVVTVDSKTSIPARRTGSRTPRAHGEQAVSKPAPAQQHQPVATEEPVVHKEPKDPKDTSGEHYENLLSANQALHKQAKELRDRLANLRKEIDFIEEDNRVRAETLSSVTAEPVVETPTPTKPKQQRLKRVHSRARNKSAQLDQSIGSSPAKRKPEASEAKSERTPQPEESKKPEIKTDLQSSTDTVEKPSEPEVQQVTRDVSLVPEEESPGQLRITRTVSELNSHEVDSKLAQKRMYTELESTNVRLTKELDEIRQKFRQQVRVSETLQKSLDDTREEISLAQKKQKRAQDKAIKKFQKRTDRKLAKRDAEIEAIKKNNDLELSQKSGEIATLRRQLTKVQEALAVLGKVQGKLAQPAVIEADIQMLVAEKNDLLVIVRGFQDEEISMLKRAKKRVVDE